jgi:hypothetical protein
VLLPWHTTHFTPNLPCQSVMLPLLSGIKHEPQATHRCCCCCCCCGTMYFTSTAMSVSNAASPFKYKAWTTGHSQPHLLLLLLLL